MKNFTLEDLKRLAAIEADVCISMYMPTDTASATTDEERIRFKNLLRRAEKTIQERAPKEKELQKMIEEGRRLLENEYFWRHQSHGLAAFIAPEVFLFYRLPVAFDEVFAVSNRFALKPLMPLFMAEGKFYVLALSQAEIRLFSCTRHSVMEIDLVDVPQGIDRKDEILRYFRDVDEGLSEILSDQKVPLVLAGVDYLLPIFREATSYQWVLPEAVPGNPDELRAEELHEKALDIVRPVMERAQHEAAQRYHELAGRGFTAAGVRSVLPAAAFGRVDTLFVVLKERVFGTYDRDNNELKITSDEEQDAEDLLDRAAVETIKNGGRVYAVNREKMPEEHAPIAAILRY
ncbi:MAG: hypothetical protein HY788_09745 [Deltaproteobacteria bacterium]|nr:hypothetical protein [Deltaproteobacteria bacterium]